MFLQRQPNEHTECPCKVCGQNIVDSERLVTGKFFVIFGHSYSQRKKEYSGEYVGVMFAMCSTCVENHNQNQSKFFTNL